MSVCVWGGGVVCSISCVCMCIMFWSETTPTLCLPRLTLTLNIKTGQQEGVRTRLGHLLKCFATRIKIFDQPKIVL